VPHARIKRIDASKAVALPGVHAVITGRDLPDRMIGRRMYDMTIIARDVVRFVGERVAAIAADDKDVAEEAVALVEVEYDELPAVFDSQEATRAGAPVLHPDLHSYKNVPKLPDVPNVHSFVEWKKGDVEAGFAEADVIYEDRYTTPMTHQGYIEPHACVVAIGEDGVIRVWSSAKQPFQTHNWMAEAIGVQKDQLVVMPISIGGDFGGKGFLLDEPVAYYLAKATGRPVKIVMTGVEEFTAAVPRHSSVMVVRTGAKKDGTLVAREATAYFNTGAYAGTKPQPTLNLGGASNLAGNYRVPNVRVRSYCVYTNQVPCGHARAPGEPQTVFAAESHLDMLAHKLGLDPFELRRKNALVDGDEGPIGEHWNGIRGKDVIERAAEESGWGSPKPSPTFGRGMAVSNRDVGGGKSSAVLRLREDGRFLLLTGVPDVGTGAHTVLRQIVAEVMGVEAGDVLVEQADTLSVPFDSGSGGSRVTHVAGQASYRAANTLKERMLDLACELYGWPEGSARLEQAAVSSAETDARVGLAELASRVARAGITLEERVEVDLAAHDSVTFSAQVAEVQVDLETGQVHVQRIVAVHDVGFVLNPVNAVGQIEGGAIFGLGYALMEEMRLEDGKVTTVSLGDYKLPTSHDIPGFRTILIQDDPGPAPFGGKATGEVSTGVVAPAIANAIYDAVGVRITDLPLSAEKIRRALRVRASAAF
jgi:CO/xanthine dehydrogenase Mo-binding subunit